MATADFDGDGNLDLAVADDTDPGSVSILLGNPDGSFRTPAQFTTGPFPFSVASGDFNGDGKPDLAVANESNGVRGTVSILLGKGDGTFANHVDYPTGVAPFSVTTGDFNGDGKLDLAVANYTDSTVSILLGNGDGTFRTHVDYATGMNPVSLTTADFNGDGKLDLAVGAGVGVSVLLGNGDGTFRAHVDYPTANPTTSATGPIVAGDFNRDGKADLAVGNTSSDTVSVLLGNGDGTFLAHVDYATGVGPVSITALDLNGDGNLDLAGR